MRRVLRNGTHYPGSKNCPTGEVFPVLLTAMSSKSPRFVQPRESLSTLYVPSQPKSSTLDGLLVSERPVRSVSQQQWRDAATAALDAAGLPAIALAFKYCGDPSANFTLACTSDPMHFNRVCPKTCKNRFCSECEHYAQAKRLSVFVPAIDAALKDGPSSYRLRHIVMTTPVPLAAADAHEKLICYWKHVNQSLNKVAWRELEKQNKLSAPEIRRGRIDLKKHGMGAVIGAEFGEAGHKLHFHILWWGCWIAADWLTEEYRKYTADESKVVKIRAVKDAGKGAKEVLAKYATKLTELPPNLVPTLHNVLKGTRRVRGYGVFYNIPREELPKCECDVCGAKLQIWNTEVYEQWRVDISAVRAERALLNLIRGNKSGENRGPPPSGTQLALPHMPEVRPNRLKYFDAME